MATLENEKLEKQKNKRRNAILVMMFLVIISCPLVVELVNGFLTGLFKDIGNFSWNFNYFHCIKSLFTHRVLQIIAVLYVGVAGYYIFMETSDSQEMTKSTEQKISENIWIPVAVGNGQYGKARFQTEDEKRKTYTVYEYTGKSTKPPVDGGVIVEKTQEGTKEIIKYLSGAVHAIIIAATRKGKTRRVFLPTIWLNLISGVNMLINDCKGEIYLSTHLFAKMLGYKEITFDLRNPELGMCHNFLIDIINSLKAGDISEATEKTWDLVSVLVGEPKGEKIWNDGECATIAAIILLVAQDAPEECKNLTNVYYFLAYMSEPDEDTGEIPINTYIERLPDSHPAKAAFQVAKIAPYRTRSSFFTSALGTLRLFTDWKIADMTSKSEYDLSKIDDEKTIIYLIIPDEKKSRYAIASLYIKQVYEKLIDIATLKGGSLDHIFEFELDEFGNMPTIPGMGSMLSAGAGRNIYFRLVLQEYEQLKKNYKDDFNNIKTNCELTICLGSPSYETNKELSNRLGTYTVELSAANTSVSERKNEVNHATSANMGSRPLLYPAEIEGIEKPDALVLYGKNRAIMHLPDISTYRANKDFGLGDKEFNKKLFVKRQSERKAREVTEPALWGIWKELREKIIQKKIEEMMKEKTKRETGGEKSNEKVSLM